MFLISNFLTQTTSTTTRRPTTTTTTTVKPRLFNYYEEGGWKILRQEEEKEKHKYDFLYHTENGIYGEEKAHLHPGAGTAASGYYEYTGDDGELYRVNYKSDHRGFIPEGDHIPTPPPVPDAIKRALEYVAKKKETHGQVQTGQYEHKSDPIRRQNMPTIDRPLTGAQPRVLPSVPSLPRPLTLQQPSYQQPRPLPSLPSLPRPLTPQQPNYQQPRALPPLPTLAPIAAQPRFTQYSGSNQYNPLPTIAPQNAPKSAYQLPSLLNKRPADQLIQQTQLTQQSQPDALPQVQVLLPQVEVQKPVELVKPVQAIELSAPVQLPQKIQVSNAPVEEVKAIVQSPLPQIELKPIVQAVELSAPVQIPQKVEVLNTPVVEVKAIVQAPLPRIELKPIVAEEQPQSDQPQSDQPQQSKPEQLSPKEEIPISGNQNAEQLKTEQSVESIVFVKPDSTKIEAKVEPASKNPEISAEASEKDNTFQPPYQVPEELKDKDDFELLTA